MAEVSLPRIRISHPHVRCDQSVLAGSPHVDGSRVPVRRLWAWHRGGASVETLVKRYPNLGAARILDALAFAYDNQDLVEADIAREQALFEKQGPSVGARPLSQLALFEEPSAAPQPASAPKPVRASVLPAPPKVPTGVRPARKR
ncbi:MAG: DUF433 domain-containing protein [Minicystis sp.]